MSSIPDTGGQEEAPEQGKLILCEGDREHVDKWHTHVPRTWWEAPTNAQEADQCHCEDSLDHLWNIVVIRKGFHLRGWATVGAKIFKGWITFLPFWDGTHRVFQTWILAHSLHCIIHSKVLVRWRSSVKHFFLSGKLTSNELPEVRDEIYFAWTQSCWVFSYHSCCSHFYHVQFIRTIKFLAEYFYSTLHYECNQICTHPEWYFSHLASDFHNAGINIWASHSVIPLQIKEENRLY